jgi:hypothetical protein
LKPPDAGTAARAHWRKRGQGLRANGSARNRK